jgi:hypothetical protein
MSFVSLRHALRRVAASSGWLLLACGASTPDPPVAPPADVPAPPGPGDTARVAACPADLRLDLDASGRPDPAGHAARRRIASRPAEAAACLGGGPLAEFRVAEFLLDYGHPAPAGQLAADLYRRVPRPELPGRPEIVDLYARARRSTAPDDSVQALRDHLREAPHERALVHLLLEIQRERGRDGLDECELLKDTPYGIDCLTYLRERGGGDDDRQARELVREGLWRRGALDFADVAGWLRTYPALARDVPELRRCAAGRCTCGWQHVRGDARMHYALARARGTPEPLRRCAALSAAALCVRSPDGGDVCPEAITHFFRDLAARDGDLPPAAVGAATATAAWHADRRHMFADLLDGKGAAWAGGVDCEREAPRLFALHFALAGLLARRPLASPAAPYLTARVQTCRVRQFYFYLHHTDMPCREHPRGTGGIECDDVLRDPHLCGVALPQPLRCGA